jgi:hypothetical protein
MIGIDPGWSGGMALLDGDGVLMASDPMPATEKDIWLLIYKYKNMDDLPGCNRFYRTVAALELVSGYVGDRGNPGSAMFKFGTNYGALRMALCGLQIPYRTIHPATWQRGVGVNPIKGESKPDRKRRLKARAQEIFPSDQVTLKNADALLLAEYGRTKGLFISPEK